VKKRREIERREKREEKRRERERKRDDFVIEVLSQRPHARRAYLFDICVSSLASS